MFRLSRLVAATAARRAFASSAPASAAAPSSRRLAPLAALAAGAAAGTAALAPPKEKTKAPPPPPAAAPPPTPAGPVYTREQVATHASPGDVWVTYQDGVYDVSEFVAQHPGGPARLMLAAGGALDPFWAAYAQHQTPEVRALLEPYRIGTLAPGEPPPPAADDPYGTDPPRHPALRVRTAKPFNGETPAAVTTAPLTPTDLHYVRNHLPVPVVQAGEEDAWAVTVRASPDAPPITVTVGDLKSGAYGAPATVTATLQCSGNRRNELSAVKPVQGLEWDSGAVSTATWTGVRLSDVLAAAGLTRATAAERGVAHVLFDGGDVEPGGGVAYGASIPARRALDPAADVLLAWAMNGAPLPPDHGAPLRVVVPGVTAARSVKWVRSVAGGGEESESHWQRKDYRTFSPSTDWGDVDWEASPSIMETNVTSAIADPAPGARLEGPLEEVAVSGWAFSGGGRGIMRVDVTADGGATWTTAALTRAPGDGDGFAAPAWAWTQWTADVPLPPAAQTGEITLAARAVDTACNVQPESAAHVWNLRGLCANHWARSTITVTDES